MKAFAWWIATAAALAVVAALSGCAPDVSINSYDGRPASSSTDQLGGVSAIWVGEEAQAIAVTTWGSSSCTTYPTSVSAPESTLVEVTTARGGGLLCTADMAAHTFEIARPENVDPASEVTLKISDGTWDTTVELAPVSR
ncbi:hypothetical protein [Salinibacterium sp. ZJ454]|uniref:hypothetical protein n=1 Tax=Salinibacterium sp. ZJ454 TaxID=2708339 RepID=UPI001421EF63|nr:hypothetical protein [Salinibacterium sp. ZJ454]